MHRRKWCPLCRQMIYPTVVVPEAPDYWMRLVGDEWLPTTHAPRTDEVPTLVSYRCNPCGKSFRLVISVPAVSEEEGSAR